MAMGSGEHSARHGSGRLEKAQPLDSHLMNA